MEVLRIAAFSHDNQGGNMNTDQKRPMNEAQLEYVKNEIKKTYLYLIGHTTYDPDVR